MYSVPFARKAPLDALRCLRHLATVVSVCALAGCATTPDKDVYEPRSTGSADSIVLLPPGAGGYLRVVQTQYTNALEQTISLTTDARSPSQNYIKVQSFSGVAHSVSEGGLQDIPLANLDMPGEARGVVNFADMKLSPYYVQNSYGPFGYSMGRTATNDTCMYAWQRIEEHKSPGGSIARGAINLRMQLCGYQATEEELLNAMLNLRIRGVTGGLAGTPRFVIVGSRALSTVSAFPGNVLPLVVQQQPVTRPRAVTRIVEEEEPEVYVPPATGPTVPTPTSPGSGTGGPTVPGVPGGSTGGSSGPTVPSPGAMLIWPFNWGQTAQS